MRGRGKKATTDASAVGGDKNERAGKSHSETIMKTSNCIIYEIWSLSSLLYITGTFIDFARTSILKHYQLPRLKMKNRLVYCAFWGILQGEDNSGWEGGDYMAENVMRSHLLAVIKKMGETSKKREEDCLWIGRCHENNIQSSWECAQ